MGEAKRRVHERYKVGEGWEYPFRLSENSTARARSARPERSSGNGNRGGHPRIPPLEGTGRIVSMIIGEARRPCRWFAGAMRRRAHSALVSLDATNGTNGLWHGTWKGVVESKVQRKK
ncbi:hypothetical protein B0H14DRAFT_2596297 [Mycena olivaceomarginata]|nr:hypothetical protein B0H14DRAFT_2596297 [Mycena olivaceomarginata]